MAKIVREDLWKAGPSTIVFVTTNSVAVRGALVMGKGSALEARQRFANVDHIIGFKLCQDGLKLDGTEFYGVKIIYEPQATKYGLGILQTKRNWRHNSTLQDVAASLDQLRKLAEANPQIQYRTVLPGIGCGHLPVNQVMSICKSLPDNVVFCHK